MSRATIPWSARGQVLSYLTECRVAVEEGSVVTQRKDGSRWITDSNIPRENLALLVLGHGTTLTHDAGVLLGEAHTVVMFTRNEGCSPRIQTPLMLVSGAPPEESYLQSWAVKWADPAWRLRAAKVLCRQRVQWVADIWPRLSRPVRYMGCASLDALAAELLHRKGFMAAELAKIDECGSTEALFGWEGEWVKALRRILFGLWSVPETTRDYEGTDLLNRGLNTGHSLAYGIASIALQGLGLAPGMGVMHGTTNRGALVFDLAEPLKDALVLPCCIAQLADKKADEAALRDEVIKKLTQKERQALKDTFELAKRLTAVA